MSDTKKDKKIDAENKNITANKDKKVTEKKEKIKIKKTLSVNSCSIIVFISFFILSTYKKSI